MTELWIGIHPTGISVYNQDNKLAPVVSFIWSETERITFKNKKVHHLQAALSSFSVAFVLYRPFHELFLINFFSV